MMDHYRAIAMRLETKVWPVLERAGGSPPRQKLPHREGHTQHQQEHVEADHYPCYPAAGAEQMLAHPSAIAIMARIIASTGPAGTCHSFSGVVAITGGDFTRQYWAGRRPP